MNKVQVKFGDWIEGGFNLYKANFGTLVLASVFAVVISTVTAGLLAGPMLAGLALVTLQLFDRKEPKPEAGKVFKGFDFFVQSFLFVVVWGIFSKPASIESVATQQIELTPSAHARDVVTAILSDFRGLDTMGEITVIGITMIGLITLLQRPMQRRGRE